MIQLPGSLRFFRKQQRRRWLVVLYCSMVVTFVVLGLARQRFLYGILIIQVINLPGLLGGVRVGGLVKTFNSEAAARREDYILRLGIASELKPIVTQLLDERETFERDRIHYRAYVLLRIGFLIAAVLYWVGSSSGSQWLMRNTPMLLWLAVIVVWSLPQLMILWIEPDLEPELSVANPSVS